MTKIAGSGSGSISQRHGSADPDPDPHQNVMDPQHCLAHMERHLAELLDVVLYVVDLSAEGHLPAGDHNLRFCQAAREKLILKPTSLFRIIKEVTTV